MNNVKKRIKTPCIGVCSTGIGDTVCRGCKRYMHEVIEWNAYSEQQRKVVMDRLQMLLEQIVHAKIEILDEQKIQHFLKQQNIPFDASASPYCWVYDLLKAGASQLGDLSSLAINVVSPATSAVELRDEIERDFYLLSCAHYERYFQLH